MQKITPAKFRILLENREDRFAIIINHWFYYIEKGRVYRFQQHNNTKLVALMGSFYEDEINEESFMVELKKSIINQMQYDWFTDVWKETIVERVSRSTYELEAFFF